MSETAEAPVITPDEIERLKIVLEPFANIGKALREHAVRRDKSGEEWAIACAGGRGVFASDFIRAADYLYGKEQEVQLGVNAFYVAASVKYPNRTAVYNESHRAVADDLSDDRAARRWISSQTKQANA